jgi:hypothetical protein
MGQVYNFKLSEISVLWFFKVDSGTEIFIDLCLRRVTAVKPTLIAYTVFIPSIQQNESIVSCLYAETLKKPTSLEGK